MLRATQAERSKDARTLYQVIREISPLQSGGKVRIRSTDGHLLNPEEEHVEISGYFFQLFGADKPMFRPRLDFSPSRFTRRNWSFR